MSITNMSVFQHLEKEDWIRVVIGGNVYGDVVVDLGGVTTFITLLQFAQLKYEVNKFDVKEVNNK